MIYLNHILAENTPLYGNGGSVELKRTHLIAQNSASNNTALAFSAHAGTHIDAPYHFDATGMTLDKFEADFWICHEPYLMECHALPDEIITLEKYEKKFENIPEKTDILLLKTGFEKYREAWISSGNLTYITNNPGIHPELGLWLRQNRKIKMIGFDFISLSGYQNRPLGRVAHRAFLSVEPDGWDSSFNYQPILIIEDMKLIDLKSSPQKIIVSPLIFAQADGAPVTVLAEI
jgi:kynurenine formamidase